MKTLEGTFAHQDRLFQFHLHGAGRGGQEWCSGILRSMPEGLHNVRFIHYDESKQEQGLSEINESSDSETKSMILTYFSGNLLNTR